MKKAILLTGTLLLLLQISYGQYTTADIKQYIATYSDVAVKKMQEFGIPASITLAQGILESGAGTSDLARIANNHFGIKCHSDWTGNKYYKDDDNKHDCFRSYSNAAQSFDDHSKFLQQSRYSSLFLLKPTDYKGWAKGLKSCGYATNPQYAERLIKIIEDYQLYLYDIGEVPGDKNQYAKRENNVKSSQNTDVSSVNKANTPNHTMYLPPKNWHKRNTPRSSGQLSMDEWKAGGNPFKGFAPVEYPYTNRTVCRNNGVYFTVAKMGDTFYSIAVDVQLGVGELKMYNDIPYRKYEPYPGEIVYLEAKKKKAEISTHVVRGHETVRDIAQMYGIKTSALYRLNQMDKNTEIHAGQKLRLR